jgi:hypothetical protein
VRSPTLPDWFDDTRSWYYSYIQGRSPGSVTVFSVAPGEEVRDDRPGAPMLRLQPGLRTVRVLDAEGRERGAIRAEGMLRGLRFAMRRDGVEIWTSSVRSIVRKRHRLRIAGGEIWTFDTPFYWWQSLTGTTGGRRRLVGRVGPTTRYWGFSVERGRDTLELLAAVAFMHWKWWRW